MTDNRFTTINLDGVNPSALGKPQEGKDQHELPFYHEYQRHLEKEYPELVPYLTVNELAIYDDDLTFYRWETSRDRAMKCIRYTEVLDKIPDGIVEAMLTRKQEENEARLRELRKKKSKHASYELGAREFTLTYSNKWFSDEEARRQMRRAIEKLCKYYKDGDQRIIKLRAVGEVGTNGLSHVHCYYQLLGGVKITDKNFKRAYPPWDPKIKQGSTGHKGGHHANVRHDSDFLGYIEKQVTDAWLDVTVGADDPTN